jgi:hypothetical protein
MSAYTCVAGESTFKTHTPMNLSQKPSPVPNAGIYINPQLFVFQYLLDADTQYVFSYSLLNFAPAWFNVSGSVDIEIPPFDHGWCFEYL